MSNKRRKIIKELVKLFKENNIYKLKNYIKENSIKLRLLNHKFSDILIIALDCDAGLPIIKYIINQCQYDTLNYIIENHHNFNEVRNSPLSIAIKKKKFEIADYLLKCGADLNYFDFEVNDKAARKYIINRGGDLTSEMIKNIIMNNENDLLKFIFKYRVFDNQFILCFLKINKLKIPLSNRNIQNKIVKEKSKIEFNYSFYKIAIAYRNYEAINILIRNDSRANKVIIKNLFQVFNNGTSREERYQFIQWIKQSDPNISTLFDPYYFDNLYHIENKVHEITELLKGSQLEVLKNYIHQHQFPLNYFINESNDMLILSIENSPSADLMNYILQECHYSNLNYTIYIGNKRKTPLLSAIAKNHFKLADILMDCNADINYRINGNTLPYYLYTHNLLNSKNFKYIIHKNVIITSDLINGILRDKQNDLLKIIFKEYTYNNYFILQLLNLYQQKTSLSNKQLQNILVKEYHKLNIETISYKTAINQENYEAIKIMINHDKLKVIILRHLLELAYTNKKEIYTPFFNNFAVENISQNFDKKKNIFIPSHATEEHYQKVIRELIKNNEVEKLKAFMMEQPYSLPLDYFNHRTFDVLLYAIETNNSTDLLNTIIHYYHSLNYTFKKGDYRYNTPLLLALSKNNFKVADLLMKNGANINYMVNKKNMIHHFYRDRLLNTRNLKYLITHHIDITSEFIEEIIINLDNDILKKIFKYSIFDNTFIIKFLNFYKHRIAMTSPQLKNILMKEKNKIKIPKSLYETAINECPSEGKKLLMVYRNSNFECNHDAIDVFLDYDVGQQEEFLNKINDGVVFYSAIKHNNTKLLDKIMNHELFEFKKLKFKKVLKNTTRYGKIELLYLFLKNSLDKKLFDFNSIRHVLLDVLQIVTWNDGKGSTHLSTDFIKFTLEKLFSNSSFNFTTLRFENILLKMSSTRDQHLLRFIIEKSFHHEKFDLNQVNFRKVLLILNSIHDGMDNMKFFIENAFHHPSCVLMRHFNEIMDSVKDIESETFTEFLIEKSLETQNSELFSFNHYVFLKKIIVLISYLNDHKVIQKYINVIQTKIEEYNDFIIERIIQASVAIGHFNVLNCFSEKLDVRHKFSHFHLINFDNLIIKSLQNNNLYIIEFIFKNLIDNETFDYSTIHIDQYLFSIITESHFESINNIIQIILFHKYPNSKNFILKIQETKSNEELIHLLINDIDFLKVLVNNHLEVNQKDCYGNTPLIYSIKAKNPKVIRYLIEHGADLRKTDRNLIRILDHIIFPEDRLDLLKILISNHLDVNRKDDCGKTLLIYAIHNENLRIVKYLLECKADLQDVNNNLDVVHFLIKNHNDNNFEILKLLVDGGLDIDKKDEYGQTLLTYGLLVNNTPVIHYLMAKGASIDNVNNHIKSISNIILSDNLDLLEFLMDHQLNINKKDVDGNTPLIYSVCALNLQITKYLLEHGASPHDINYKVLKGLIDKSIKKDCLDILELLMTYQLNINDIKDDIDNTILMYAVQKAENTKIIQFLLDHGADINHSNYYYCTALSYGFYYNCNNEKILEYLIDHGADISSIHNNVQVLKPFILKTQHLSLLQKLVDKNLNVNGIDKEGNTILMYAILAQNESMVNYLIDIGANVNHKNRQEYTPLIYALHPKNGNKEIIKSLLDHGATIPAVDREIIDYIRHGFNLDILKKLIKNGFNIDQYETRFFSYNSFLHLIIKSKLEDQNSIVKYLIDWGVDIDSKNYRGDTPLNWAVRTRNVKLVNYFIDHGADFLTMDRYGKTLSMVNKECNNNDQYKDIYLEIKDILDNYDSDNIY